MQEMEVLPVISVPVVDLLSLADHLEMAALRDFETLRPFGLSAGTLAQIACMRDELAELPLPEELEDLKQNKGAKSEVRSLASELIRDQYAISRKLSRKLRAVAAIGQMMWQEIDAQRFLDYQLISHSLKQEELL